MLDGEKNPYSLPKYKRNELRYLLKYQSKRSALESFVPDSIDCMDKFRVSLLNLFSRVNKYGICDLASNASNELMWSYSASFHKGFVIEYDLNKLRNNQHIHTYIHTYICMFSMLRKFTYRKQLLISL